MPPPPGGETGGCEPKALGTPRSPQNRPWLPCGRTFDVKKHTAAASFLVSHERMFMQIIRFAKQELFRGKKGGNLLLPWQEGAPCVQRKKMPDLLP